MKKYLLLLLMPLLFLIAPAHAETTIPDLPANGIYDPNHYLSSETSDKLAEFNSNHDTQVGVYVVDTLDGKDIESQANEVSRAWKIGHAETNKGVLIAIAINDRKLRLETSNEASVYLTDAKAKEIISSVKSQLRSKDYSSAVVSMLDSIGTEMSKDPNEQTESKYDLPSTEGEALIAVLVIVFTGGTIFLLTSYVYGKTGKRIMYGDASYPDSGSHSRRSDYYDKDNDYITSAALGLTAAEIARRASERRKSSSSSSYSSSRDDYSGSSYDSGSSWSSGSSYDSGSSWSSGSWGGGGFDGGGSSGDW